MGGQIGFWRRRSARYGSLMVVTVLLVLGIATALVALSKTHHWRADLTKNRRYSLASQTLKILKGLNEPVRAYAFFQEGDSSRGSAEDLLNRYKYHAKGFEWEFVDPDRFPLRAKAYNVNSYNTIVLEKGDRFEKVPFAEEERITNALVKLTRKEKLAVYVLQGHGERGMENFQKDGFSEARKALENENYEVKELILARETRVPEGAALVIIAGPQKALQEEEWRALEAYLEEGGRLLILADPESAPGMAEFLKAYGVILGEDIIVDRASRLLGGDYLVPPVVQYEFHTITRDFRQSPYLVYLPLARSVGVADKPPEGCSVEVLARTGPGSWGERDLARLKRGEAELDPDDLQGPVPVGVVATLSPKGGKRQARMVVLGDSDFVTNAYIDPSRSANQDLFLNAVNWLAEQEDLISVRAKSAPSLPVVLSPGQQAVIFFVVVVGFPVAILAVGVGALWRRRWRQ